MSNMNIQANTNVQNPNARNKKIVLKINQKIGDNLHNIQAISKFLT